MEEVKSCITKNNQLPPQAYDIKNTFFSWEKCGWYCSGKLLNKTCWRLDIPCRNLKNCDSEYQNDYQLAYNQAKICLKLDNVLQRIEDDNESISHIY